MGDERRIVAAAVFGVQNQREVERFGLEMGVAAVFAGKEKYVLGGRLLGVGVSYHQRFTAVVVGLGLVRVSGDRWHGADHLDRLLKALLDGEVVGVAVIVERIGEKNRPRDRVHDVLGRIAKDRILLEAIGKLAVLADPVLPVHKLARGRQLAEKQQVRGLFVAEAVFAAVGGHDILHADAAIVQFAFDGLLLAFAHHVAVDVAYRGETHEHA